MYFLNFYKSNSCTKSHARFLSFFCLSQTHKKKHTQTAKLIHKPCGLQSPLLNSCTIWSRNPVSAHSPHD